MPFSNPTNAEIAHSMWVFMGGAILVLLQSIVSGAKRNWISLLLGCVFGGAGSWVASQIWADSKYIFIICGVAAVITENIMAGMVNASKQFKDNPIKVFSHFAKLCLPVFGKATGDAAVDEKLK